MKKITVQNRFGSGCRIAYDIRFHTNKSNLFESKQICFDPKKLAFKEPEWGTAEPEKFKRALSALKFHMTLENKSLKRKLLEEGKKIPEHIAQSPNNFGILSYSALCVQEQKERGLPCIALPPRYLEEKGQFTTIAHLGSKKVYPIELWGKTWLCVSLNHDGKRKCIGSFLTRVIPEQFYEGERLSPEEWIRYPRNKEKVAKLQLLDWIVLGDRDIYCYADPKLSEPTEQYLLLSDNHCEPKVVDNSYCELGQPNLLDL